MAALEKCESPFPLDSFPRLLYPWVLRDDKDNLLVYKCDTSELRYLVLSPAQALILPFFSGKRTYGEIQSIWLYLNKPPDRKESLDFLDKLVSNLTAPENIVGLDGYPSVSLKSNIPLPDFSRYRWPAERTSMPVSVMVSLTNRCVANCVYCYAERNQCKELTAAEWNNVFDMLFGSSIRLVDLSGGDVFLREDILEIFQEMIKRDFVFFTSTKSYISRQRADLLADLGIGRKFDTVPFRDLQISLDSVTNEIASHLTGIKNYRDKATATLTNLIEAGIDPRVKCVLTPYNWTEIEPIIRTLSEIGVRRFQFVQYGRSLYRHSGKLFLTNEQKLQLHDLMPEIVSRYNGLDIIYQDDYPTGKIIKPLVEDWNNRSICTGGRAACIILPNGDVTLCEQIPHVPEYVVGNVLKQNLSEIWNGQALEEFLHPSKERFSGTACFTCAEFEACHSERGYCYRNALSAFGSIYDAPPDCPKQDKPALRLI